MLFVILTENFCILLQIRTKASSTEALPAQSVRQQTVFTLVWHDHSLQTTGFTPNLEVSRQIAFLFPHARIPNRHVLFTVH